MTNTDLCIYCAILFIVILCIYYTILFVIIEVCCKTVSCYAVKTVLYW